MHFHESVAAAESAVNPNLFRSVPRKPSCGDARLRILLVEDDDGDAMLTREALDGAEMPYEMRILKDGQDVLPYLRRQGKYRHACDPDLLFLDLSLPVKDGFEVLADLAEPSGRFARLPIVILTGDAHCAFLKNTCNLNIAAFVTKPCTPRKIHAAIQASRKH